MPAVYGNEWYAVHLSNGQVYFGKIARVTDTAIELRETHYLEPSQASAVSSSDSFMLGASAQTTYTLVQRGSDKTLASDNTLFINRDSVLFWEKLESSSDVVSMIEKRK